MKEYTKADLVEFIKWNSNAPMKVLNKASKEELEELLIRNNAYDRFIENLDKYRYCRQMESKLRKAIRG